MEQVEKGQIAKTLFQQGYNCCQAVVGAFAEDYGMDMPSAMRMVSGFGGGMGRLREVCGAVSGMFFVLSLAKGYDQPGQTEEKKELYRHVQTLAEKFTRENGSIVCRQLLGLPEGKSNYVPQKRTKEYYKKRPCSELVYMAANMLQEYLQQI